MTRYCLIFTMLLIQSVGTRGIADEAIDSAHVKFFESKIRPVLIKHCYECHSGDTAESGFKLDSRTTIRKGGKRGPAVVPHRPQASVLLSAISHTDANLKMPPDVPRLSDSVIADFRIWIKIGAPDPREIGDQPSASDWNAPEVSKMHWAYQAPVEHPVPNVKDTGWPRLDVDRFVLAALQEQGLKPSVDATPRVMLRRMYFDLTGLPPSFADTERFLKVQQRDGLEKALAGEADRLLESPQFGERWGRHWLDVARFGESSGGESNVSFPYAWRYRDYVIDAITADVPYDRFLTEQIAGDLLPFDTKAERARLLIATGFLAVGTKNLGENDDRKFQADLIDEQIDSLTRAVMSSSVACARCHHHKFDPFSMQDYYGLAGIFASTKTYFGTFTSPANNRGGDPLVLPRVKGQKILNKSLSPEKFEQLKSRHKVLAAEREEIRAARRALFSGKQPKKRFTLREVLANTWRLGPVEGKLETLDESGKALPVTMGVLEAQEVIDVPLLAGGEIGREGEIVPRAFPKAIPVDGAPSVPGKQSGRLEFADWLTNERHPLTSRVYVNRVWKHLFGHGLVPTVDNFGTTGASPSHPELLDTLAVRFVKDGWSLKRLVRSLVLSRTYRQSSTYDAAAFNADPDNRLLWRMPKRRLEAEAIRDSMLFVSGELNKTRPVGSLVGAVIGDKPISLIGLDKRLPKDLDGSVHRSVYLPVVRDRLPDVLELFDFAEPSLVTGNRETTNVPVQALFLMNSDFVQERAQALAARIFAETNDQGQFVRRAFQLCFARDPDSNEENRSLKFLDLQTIDSTGAQQTSHAATRMSLCQALLSTAEFRNLD